MKMRKAMALALAGALVLTTVATGTTSEAAKKTKLKTKKVSIFVKGKKKISITGKKAKHKYTFTSKKKKIAKVSKTGVITGVKAGKTKITVKDTWKQKGKKKSKKLGTINVTVKKKTTPKPKVTANVPQVTPQPPAPATQDPNGGGSQPPVPTPDNSGNQPDDPTPTPTPSGNPDDPTPTPTPSGNPDDPTPTPSDNPDIKAPTAEMKIAASNIRAEENTTAEVTVSAGDVTDVTWKVDNTAVAAVQKDSSDAKKAVITGVAEGVAKVTAEVKVKVEGKDFTVKAEGTVHVAAKDALVINATIESAPTELEITKSAEMSVKVDVREEEGVTIDNILWEITKGDAATIDTSSVEAGSVIVKANKLGDVTISVTVTAKKGDKTATDTKEVTIHVTPITYDIGKEISCTGKDWGAAFLDNEITVKKTDLVEVLFSVKSGDALDSTSSVMVKLSPKTAEETESNAQRVQENAVLEMKNSNGAPAGKTEMVRKEAYFTHNYATIKSVAASISQGDDTKVVTIEKIFVTPTDELALSMHAPLDVEEGKTAVVEAEIDEKDFTSIEWELNDESKATLQVDSEDQRKVSVTGVAAGEVQIKVIIKKGDIVIKEETVTMEVRSNYKGVPIKLDLSDSSIMEATGSKSKVTQSGGSIVIEEENSGLLLKLPYKLQNGASIKVTMKGSLSADSSGFRLYTTPAAPEGGNKVESGSNTYEDMKDKSNMSFDTNATVLTASKDCDYLLVRTPSWNGLVKGVTITEVTLEYL